METKKILMVTSFYPPYHVGGACTHVYYLANEVAKKGHEVHVLYSKDAYSLKRSGEPDKTNYRNHENVHLHEIKTSLGKITPLASYISGEIPFNQEILPIFKEKWDLIHYHNISLFGPRIFHYGKARKIYTAHDHWLVCPYNDFFTFGKMCDREISRMSCSSCLVKNKRPVQLWRYAGVLKRALKNIELIISPSLYLKTFMRKNLVENRIQVMPNFIFPPEKINKVRGLDGDEYFFYAGMLEKPKGISILLSAFEDADKRLIIAGRGSQEKYVKNFIKKNKLKDKIDYVGWLDIEDIYAYSRNALAFVLPSLSPENCPLTILEAMSVGTPTIGSSIGGIPEIVEKIDKDLIFECGDIDGLRQKANNFKRSKYKEGEIREIFEKNFSAETYLDNYFKNLE